MKIDINIQSRGKQEFETQLNKCKICELLENDVDYSTSHPVYQITCRPCNEIYCGESSRPLHERLSEHLRYASNPEKASYRDEALATHYREHHPGLSPLLRFKLLHVERNTIIRKILEAYTISKLNPTINDRNECIDIKRFLIDS